MSGLTTWDSGEYWCGFYEHPYVYLLKTVYLEVAKGESSQQVAELGEILGILPSTPLLAEGQGPRSPAGPQSSLPHRRCLLRSLRKLLELPHALARLV